MTIRMGVVAGLFVLSCGQGQVDDGAGGNVGGAGTANGGSQSSTPDDNETMGGGGIGGDAGAAGHDGDGGAAEDALVVEAERGIDPDQIIEDDATLADTGFTLSGSLCPDSWPEDSFDPGEPMSLKTFYVRSSEDGGLEAVVSTFAEGDHVVEVLPMQPMAHGFRLSEVSTCAHTGYTEEDLFTTERYRAKSLQVVFFRESPEAQLEARLAATAAAGIVSSPAVTDTTAPSVFKMEKKENWDAVDDCNDEPFTKCYSFTEPLGEDSELSFVGEGGTPLNVTYVTSAGFKVGVRINDAWSGKGRMDLDLYDQSGNHEAISQTLTGLSLAPLVGDFEGDEEEALDLSDPYTGCGEPIAATSPISRGLNVDVPPLAGAKSFLLGESGRGCKDGFRLSRSADATKLRFEARAIGDWESGFVNLCLRSLAGGDTEHCTKLKPSWSADAAFADAPKPVSEIQTLEVDLPSEGDDLLLTISTSPYLWFDSLRLE